MKKESEELRILFSFPGLGSQSARVWPFLIQGIKRTKIMHPLSLMRKSPVVILLQFLVSRSLRLTDPEKCGWGTGLGRIE